MPRQFFLIGFLAVFLAFPLAARPLFKQNGMVTSSHRDATLAGVEILKMGGNAVDAAVATTLAISVVEPFAAGIGGGGFLLLHLSKPNTLKALDFRETAPLLATETMYQDKHQSVSSVAGYHAVAVPGTMAGLYEVHKEHGKLRWNQLFAPAIRLAKNGFEIDSKFVDAFDSASARLKNNPIAWKTFTLDGKRLPLGFILKQPELAASLKTLSKNPRDFYEGTIAKKISEEMLKNKGIVTLNDLKQYQPKWRTPLCGEFMQLKICSMPPPSSGGIVLLQMLNAISELGTEQFAWHEPKTIHTLAQIMRTAFQARSQYLGDPDFVDIPVEKLLSKKFISEQIGKESKTLPKESNDTSHINVVDEHRNAVSLTFTVNLGFGSGVVVEGTGILLNNEMDDFASQPNVPNAFGLVQGAANKIEAGKIPLSSMTPVIAFNDKGFHFAVGSPGGSRIITTVFHTIINHLVYGMNIEQAISAGRFHHQWMPDEISYEKNSLDPETVRSLVSMGNRVKEENPPMNTGMILAPEEGGLLGAIDPRGHGYVFGY